MKRKNLEVITVSRKKAPGRGYFITVPKKVLPKAVDRNTIKRRIRAALEDLKMRRGLGRLDFHVNSEEVLRLRGKKLKQKLERLLG